VVKSTPETQQNIEQVQRVQKPSREYMKSRTAGCSRRKSSRGAEVSIYTGSTMNELYIGSTYI